MADAHLHKPFCWNVEMVDLDGPFGWRVLSIDDLFRNVIPRLHGLEKMSWASMVEQGCHDISIELICRDARQRLAELGYEFDSLYSVRVTGRRRIFGQKDGAIFRMLWWDPDHQICPSVKKHT